MVGANARRAVLEYGGEMQLRRHESSPDEGEAVHEFSDPEPIWGSLRPEEEGREFEIGIEGQEDATVYQLAVIELPSDVPTGEVAAYLDHHPKVVHPPPEEDDRVLADNTKWRLVKRRHSPQNDLARFLVIEDGRGESQDVDDDGTGDDTDTPPFSPIE